MKKIISAISSRDNAFAIVKENRKLIIQFILTAIFVYAGFWFISHEKTEILNVKDILRSANGLWMLSGILLFIFYVFLRGLMFVTSFASIGQSLSLKDSLVLFLKRNFISVFLPAGGISSLVFFTADVEKKGITKSQIFFASSLNAFVSILTVVIVAIPAFILVISGTSAGNWIALAGVIFILILLIYAYYSLKSKSGFYNMIIRIFPRSAIIMEDLSSHRIKFLPFLYTVIISIVVEITGILHAYIAMAATGSTTSIQTAIVAYIVVVMFLTVSPFLKGLGVIEVSMTYVLIQAGYGKAEAIAITLLFRFFEFWLPLAAGVLSFFRKTEKLFLRILPAILIFTLGIVNVISVVTPSIPWRMKLLGDFLFMDVISFSKIFVLVSGLLLLLTATFMFRGLRTAWWFALILSTISALGHILKGIDYEEATLALFVIGSLLVTRKEYYIRSIPGLRSKGAIAALISIGAVLIFGITGFYFLDKAHFRIDFSITQSIKYTLQNFFLVGSRDLFPADTFARDFVNLIKISGLFTISYLVYTLVRPFILRLEPTTAERERAMMLVERFGRSSLDYFKTYSDKLIFAPEEINAFISYRISKSFAIVLEDPVSENTGAMKECIASFSRFCYDNGLQDIYYRVPAESLKVYKDLSFKSMFIGQEALVDLEKFSLSGCEMKPVRNALNKIKAEGHQTRVYTPPLPDGLLQKLKTVSNEWLESTGRSEIVFSQGRFSEKEIKNQTIITVENKEERVMAFLTIIPDYVKDEGTYDLQRKAIDAPNGIMDHLLIELFNKFKSDGKKYVNLGFAPMSGVNDPHNFPERSMKFAYEKIRSFSTYRGLRDYKDKFQPEWKDKYLIYKNDYDLFKVPAVLSSVIKP